MKSVTPYSTTPIRRVNPRDPEAEVIAWAASVLRSGGVIIYPTETFYGLGASPMLEAAVERVYQVKGRDFKKPLPLIASGVEAVHQAVAQWPPGAARLAQAFWPGPLTLVLPAAPHVPAPVHAHTGKIAVRVSSHPVARALSFAVGGLLISTSANPTDRPASRDPDAFPGVFLAKVDGLLHAGQTQGHMPSTIVDMSFDPPKLVRAGCISWKDVLKTYEL